MDWDYKLTLNIRNFEPADAQRWNDFVTSHADGTFFHLVEWREVLIQAFRLKPYYLLAERDGVICAVLPLARVSSWIFGDALISTPFCVYGGVVAEDEYSRRALTDRAISLAKELEVDHLELRNRQRQNPDWPVKELYVTFRKSISSDSEQNMLSIPRKQRAMVRKGIQKSLTSHIGSDVDQHFQIYSESLRNLGTPVFSVRYLQILKQQFGERCEILNILHGEVPVASVLSFYFRNEVLPYYGGSVLAARTVAGNDFMYWEVMERARQRGCSVFDFGRSKRGTGAFDFKVHWGFEPEQLYYEYFLVRAKTMPNLSPTNPKYDLFIRAWKYMPLSLTRFIGPLLARYLG